MSQLRLSRSDLDWASGEGLLSAEQASALWTALEARGPSGPRFDLPHVAYYAGALVVISAMGWFLTEAWESLGGEALTGIALVYGVIFSAAGRELWFKRDLRVPGGLLFTVAVCMTPLAIFGVEEATGLWPQGDPGDYTDYYVWVRGSWLFMELGTIAVGLIALRYVPFPFLTAPIAFALWFLSMDLTPLLLGRGEFTWEERRQVSLWFGLAMLLATYLVDRRTRLDYAFWGYLFGLAAFWCGLSMSDSDSELEKLGYFGVNVVLIVLSLLLQRRAFIVFGSLGVFVYLSHLAQTVFADSLAFPIVLSGIGVSIMFAGVTYQKHEARIEAAVAGLIPESLRRVLPASRVRGPDDDE